jgi:hypothetical protein
MAARRRRRFRRFHTAVAVTLAVIAVILSPILLPIALWLDARDQKRMRALIDTFPCLKCGEVLGAEALRLAGESWSAYLAGLRDEDDGRVIRRRIVRNFDAICPHCGSYHTFDPKGRNFTLTPPEYIQIREGGRARSQDGGTSSTADT